MHLNQQAAALFAKPANIFSLSTKLTIGGAVCISEGLAASILAIIPKDHWFYIGSLLLAMLIWMAFWRFRDNKMGADIGDICFLEFLIRIAALSIYFGGEMNKEVGTIFWYVFTSISAMKLIRVYLWQSSATQQFGWGRFGIMTLHYARNNHPAYSPAFPRKVAKEVVLGLGTALIFSFFISQMSDLGRLIAGWVVPMTFEFTNGPVQLRCLSALQNLLMASNQRESEKDERIAELEKRLAEREIHSPVSNEMISEIATALENTAPDKHEHLLNYIKRAMRLYPANKDNGP